MFAKHGKCGSTARADRVAVTPAEQAVRGAELDEEGLLLEEALHRVRAERATSVSATTASLAWQPSVVQGSSKNVEYVVSVDGRDAARTSSTRAVLSGLTPATAHRFDIRAASSSAEGKRSTPFILTLPAAAGPKLYEAEAANSILEGTASRNGCGGCSAGGTIGNIGGDSAFSFVDIVAPMDGTYLVTVAYTDGDVSRQGRLAVGDTTPVQVNFPGWGDNDWDTPATMTVSLDLKAGANQIRVDHRPVIWRTSTRSPFDAQGRRHIGWRRS